MSLFPIAILISVIAFFASAKHLNQSLASYFDLVALLMVLGGTITVTMIALPWQYKSDIKKAIKLLFIKNRQSQKIALMKCLNYISGKSLNLSSKNYYEKLLSDADELIQLNLTSESVESILRARVDQYMQRQRKVANAIKGLSKYPPAFGLMGTVVGLVNVMTGVSNGVDARETAFKMAIALVATMYGLIVSNLIINPMGELILKCAQEDESLSEIVIESIKFKMDGLSLLEAQEYLNSWVDDENRYSLLSDMNKEAVS